jgi:ATP-dependent RNA helicase RhlE
MDPEGRARAAAISGEEAKMKFNELQLVPELVRNVTELGYTAPTPIQQMAIPLALAGKDVLGRAQTGTGKTAAFVLPTLQRLMQGDSDALRALVLCPTRELAIQVGESARSTRRTSASGSVCSMAGTSVEKDVRDLRAGFDVLVATPGRLIDHLERGNVELSQVEVLVLDEADRMLDMGFRPQIESIMRYLPKRGERQTLFFSATMPNSVRRSPTTSCRTPRRLRRRRRRPRPRASSSGSTRSTRRRRPPCCSSCSRAPAWIR